MAWITCWQLIFFLLTSRYTNWNYKRLTLQGRVNTTTHVMHIKVRAVKKYVYEWGLRKSLFSQSDSGLRLNHYFKHSIMFSDLKNSSGNYRQTLICQIQQMGDKQLGRNEMLCQLVLLKVEIHSFVSAPCDNVPPYGASHSHKLYPSCSFPLYWQLSILWNTCSLTVWHFLLMCSLLLELSVESHLL